MYIVIEYKRLLNLSQTPINYMSTTYQPYIK